MHHAVMVDEVVRLLLTDPSGTYVDLNVGGGGHAEAICAAAGNAAFRYIGLDLDPEAISRTRERLHRFGERVRLVEANHKDVRAVLAGMGVKQVTGMLFDLGFSSWQLDEAARGFAFDRLGPLDMRYARSGRTAREILADASEKELAALFREGGEVRSAEKLARAIVHVRGARPILTTRDLAEIVESALRPPFGQRAKLLAQVFQALRVAVNEEVGSFRVALDAADDLVAEHGVLCVLAFESTTDRLIKHHLHPTDVPKDAYGHRITAPRWERLTKHALRPSDEEVLRNPRARSARLRAGRRTEAA